MRAILLVAGLLLLAQPSPSGLAAENTSKSSPVTGQERESRAERHEKMADVHKKMADCLRSDRSLSECQDQMRNDCPMRKEGGHCPMMDEWEGGGMGKGRGRGSRMRMDKTDKAQQKGD